MFRPKRILIEQKLAKSGVDVNGDLGKTFVNKAIKQGWNSNMLKDLNIKIIKSDLFTEPLKKFIAFECEIYLRPKLMGYIIVVRKQDDVTPGYLRWNVRVRNPAIEEWDDEEWDGSIVFSKFDSRGRLIEYV